MPRTITDIVPPSRRRAMNQESAPVEPPPPSRDSRPRRPRRFPYGLALAALVVVALSVGAIYAFAGARIDVTPTVSDISVSGEFAATPSVGDLPFESISVETTATQSVPAEGTENANDPAQGTITIFNEQTKTQELIKNTRFETAEGLVYRIHESVTIPAGSAQNPGTLQVTVYADAGGERYNIGPSTFTLPGLKGSSLFDQVYARSTGPMTGGFSGTRPSVTEATRTTQYESMKATLAADLMEAVHEKVTEDYILVPGATSITYVPQSDTAGASGTVNVVQKGMATAIIFPKEALARALAYQTIGMYGGEPIRIESAENLRLTPAEEGEFAPGAQSLGFTLSGDAKLIWTVDPSRIAGAVAGKTRESAETILSGFPEVDRAVLVLRPFWTRSLPSDPADITIRIMEAQ